MPSDHIFFILLGGLAVGMAIGIVPLLMALKRKRENLGYALFAICIVSALVGGFLACIPASIISILIILFVTKKTTL
jgi:biotin transporter BioY